MAVLFLLSTSALSAPNTSRVIESILRWIFPSASLVTITVMHKLYSQGGALHRLRHPFVVAVSRSAGKAPVHRARVLLDLRVSR
jgi:hypothetical protein